MQYVEKGFAFLPLLLQVIVSLVEMVMASAIGNTAMAVVPSFDSRESVCG